MTLPRSAADVLSGHVVFELECIDRIYLLTEHRDVTAAQKTERPLRSVTTLAGMSRSAGRKGHDLGPDTTESGHPVPNDSPASSSLLLVCITQPRP